MTAPNNIATLHYGDGEFIVLKAGTHVRCAVSGELITLGALRYWCSERQEAYLGPWQYIQAHNLMRAAAS